MNTDSADNANLYKPSVKVLSLSRSLTVGFVENKFYLFRIFIFMSFTSITKYSGITEHGL